MRRLLPSGSLAALVVAGSLLGGAACAEAASWRIAPLQQEAILLSKHRAWSQPTERSTLVGVVHAQRPLTGERTVLPVLQSLVQDGRYWLRVRLPGRPNGLTGWIHQGGTRYAASHWHILVNTTTRQVRVYHDGIVVRRFLAVVGKPSTPTPLGEFFVEENVLLGPGDAGAPFALATSARSDVLQEFAGGPGQIALHGVGNIGGIPGTAVSHGCIRLATRAISWLAARIGPGVPVTIVS